MAFKETIDQWTDTTPALGSHMNLPLQDLLANTKYVRDGLTGSVSSLEAAVLGIVLGITGALPALGLGLTGARNDILGLTGAVSALELGLTGAGNDILGLTGAVSALFTRVSKVTYTGTTGSFDLDPNKLHVFPTMTELGVKLVDGDPSYTDEARFQFTSGSPATVFGITGTDTNLSIRWKGVTGLSYAVAANTTYDVRVEGGLGTWTEYTV